jgi:dTDP-4-dehydrorhamnose reductase
MQKSKVLVTGANGQLGKELQVISLLEPDLEFIFLSRNDLPIQDPELVEEKFETIRPQFCINCAAYTAVDKAETETGQAFKINGESTAILAAACSSHNVRFIHISTDYVFDGKATQPYTENDTVNPVNAYGASKLLGEELALSRNPHSVIIRTSWVYSEFGNNFVKTMLRLMKEREFIGVVNDQWGSPTYAADLAKALIHVISSSNWAPGIYHYSNEGVITWYQFAEAIKENIKSSCIINPITTEAFPTPAKRPGYSVFDKSKIRSQYQLSIPDWQVSLQACLQKLKI